jgi:Flp pilus assembly protein TadB
LFRRTKSDAETELEPAVATSDTATDTTTDTATQKKSRPTPTRKEAEAANKAKAKIPRTRKERAAAQKLARSESSAKMRQAMRTGEDRYLPARDRGPVRRFIRDYIDSRFSLIELLIPIMLIVLVVGWSGNTAFATYANLAMLAVFLLIVMDLFRLRFRLRRELATRFPDSDTHGTTYYAIARSLQMRFMRLPKAQVKIGQELPERYR